MLLTLERLEDRTTPSSVTHISPASGPTGGGGVEIDGSGFTGATGRRGSGARSRPATEFGDFSARAFAPVVSPALADSTASAPGGVAVPTDSLSAAAAAPAGLDEAAAPPAAVGFPSVASPPPPAPVQPQPGPSDSQLTTVPGGANDLAFQLISADLNLRIELLWPLENATDAGEFDTDSLSMWG